MAGLLGHLSSEDRDLIERGVHSVIDSDYHVREEFIKESCPGSRSHPHRLRYEIELIPNYGNDTIIINEAKRMRIKTSGKTRESGFAGCDVPVILDIECTEENKNKLQEILRSIATDSFTILKRCPTCGSCEVV